jgi:methionine-rich copper-binding protein CopC
MKKHYPLLLALIGTILFGGVSPALAHAFLQKAEPGVGSEVSERPRQVKIWFTEKLEGPLCRIQVFTAANREIDQHDCRMDPQNPALLEVSLPPDLPSGSYQVVWKAVSVDTHTTTGKFMFTVKG